MAQAARFAVARTLAAAALLCTAPAAARAQFLEERVGMWSISGHLRNGAFSHCAMSTRGAHSAKSLLFYIGRGVFQLAIADNTWSMEVGTRFDAYYRIDGGPQVAVSARAVRPNILNFRLPASKIALEQLRTASTLRLGVMGAREMTYDFTMPNSAGAFDRLWSCAGQGLRMAAQPPQAGTPPGSEAPRARPPAPRPQERASAPPAAPGAASPNTAPRKPAEARSAGTGFYVSLAGHILTAEHVIRGCKTVRAQPVGGVPEIVALVAKSESDDLALLKSAAKPAAAAPLRGGAPRLGESVVLFGFPLAGTLASSGNLTAGNVAALAGLKDDHRLMQISAPAQPGNSGGPVFDLRGRVAGVLVSGVSAAAFVRATGTLPQNINFAVKASIVASFLEAHGVPAQIGGAEQDLSVADVAERARGFTVRIECAAE